jgi:hypothetical protein
VRATVVVIVNLIEAPCSPCASACQRPGPPHGASTTAALVLAGLEEDEVVTCHVADGSKFIAEAAPGSYDLVRWRPPSGQLLQRY